MLGSSGISGYDVVFAQAWRERTSVSQVSTGREGGKKVKGMILFNSEENDIDMRAAD